MGTIGGLPKFPEKRFFCFTIFMRGGGIFIQTPLLNIFSKFHKDVINIILGQLVREAEF